MNDLNNETTWGKNFSTLTKLYELFQFEKIEDDKNYVVYHFNSGYFNIVEIFTLLEIDDDEVIKIKKKYEDVDFIVKVVKYKNLLEAHDTLYRGFFSLEKTIKTLEKTYSKYKEQQQSHLAQFDQNAEYKYISGAFYKEGTLNNSDGIVDIVSEEMLDDAKKLIILEAAAGMGKTSTSYEILQVLLEKRKGLMIPLLIELTKNRGARIFRHVLDDEIDRNFPLLKRDLILEEINNGNILLIIDGFDELISKQDSKSADDEQSNAQSMLDTIAELFKENSKARILLTSRKSTMFVGEKFDTWKDGVLNDVNVCRYQLAAPTVKDWLGFDKINIFENKGISMDSLRNPVLLAALRCMSDEDISNIDDGKSLADLYFTRLLEREKTRQELYLDVQEQFKVFEKLAKEFVDCSMIAEDSCFIQELLLECVLKDDLDKYMSRYIMSESKPNDKEEFARKFIHHALMDRIKPFSNEIGFINEFVFGTFIANAIIDDMFENRNVLLNSDFVMMAADAFSIENKERRADLYKKIEEIVSILDPKQQLSIELSLLNGPAREYKGAYFDSITFNDTILNNGTFKDCIFSTCIFSDCEIVVDNFIACSFINCQFYNNKINCEERASRDLSFVGCIGHEEILDYSIITYDESAKSVDYRKIILENFWNPGKNKADSRRSLSTIFRGTSQADRGKISEALEELLKDDILRINCGYYDLNHSKMGIIRKILER